MSSQVTSRPEILAGDEWVKTILEDACSKLGLEPGRHGWRSIKTWRTSSVTR